MATTLCFYISGHGYGHARRMTQIIREFVRRRPDIAVRIRSAAPPRIFEPLPSEWVASCEIDSGIVETDPLQIDRESTLRQVLGFMGRRDAIIASEVAALRHPGPSLIVADIPFLAGDVAAAVGVPCVGISNFTWNWIYSHLFAGDARYAGIAPSIAASYSKMSEILELPFGRTCPAIARRTSTPMVAMRSGRTREEVLAQVGVSPGDRRSRVLVGTRGGLPADALAALARDAAEFLLLCPNEPPATLPANGISIPIRPGLDFSDALLISDIVVSKLGYGIVSECIATQTRLLWPPREGFVEDAVMEQESTRFVPMLRMDLPDYRGGRWGKYLREAMILPSITEPIRTDGAAVCAELLARRI